MNPLAKHLIIGTIGEPGVGRKTFLYFLSELMAEDGYENFTVIEPPLDLTDELTFHRNNKLEVQSTEIYKVGVLMSTKNVAPKIIFVPSIETLAQANLIKHVGGILIRIRRNEYKHNGNSEVIINHTLPDNLKWLNDCSTDYHVTNHETLRRFNFMTRTAYADLVKLEKWKSCLTNGKHNE